MCRKWKEECEIDPSTTPLHEWIKMVVHNIESDVHTLEDTDRMLLSKKPS
jgi:hypothetical protein